MVRNFGNVQDNITASQQYAARRSKTPGSRRNTIVNCGGASIAEMVLSNCSLWHRLFLSQQLDEAYLRQAQCCGGSHLHDMLKLAVVPYGEHAVLTCFKARHAPLQGHPFFLSLPEL